MAMNRHAQVPKKKTSSRGKDGPEKEGSGRWKAFEQADFTVAKSDDTAVRRVEAQRTGKVIPIKSRGKAVETEEFRWELPEAPGEKAKPKAKVPAPSVRPVRLSQVFDRLPRVLKEASTHYVDALNKGTAGIREKNLALAAIAKNRGELIVAEYAAKEYPRAKRVQAIYDLEKLAKGGSLNAVAHLKNIAIFSEDAIARKSAAISLENVGNPPSIRSLMEAYAAAKAPAEKDYIKGAAQRAMARLKRKKQ